MGLDLKDIEDMMNRLAAYAIQHQGSTSHYDNFHTIRLLALTGIGAAAGGDPATSGEAIALERLKQLLDKGQKLRLIDAGANQGDWTLLARRIIPNSAITCVEASKAGVRKLYERFKDLEEIYILHAALTSEAGQEVRIYSDGQASGHGSVFNKLVRHEDGSLQSLFGGFETCRTTTVDEAFPGEEIDLLKLDIEGAELAALAGAENAIKNNTIKAIQFEVGTPQMEARTYFRDFWLKLNERFHIALIMKDGLKRIEAYHESLETFMCQNYLAIRKDLV